MTFSYNPANIADFTRDRMRFELGDCLVEEGAKTTYLTDEEIEAVISSSSSWKVAQYRLVDSLIKRFAYEVDEKADPISWSWHQRYEQWKKLRDELKDEVEGADSSPLIKSVKRSQRPPYFFEDMHNNHSFRSQSK